jgi:Family of unknown function (DUF5759)
MGDNQPPKLQPQHLFEKREKRDKARLRAYNQLLEQIQHRIYTTSQLPGNPSYLVYNVPPFILGLPSMDLKDCIVYLVYQLRTNGFEVRFTYPNLLYISWGNYEKEYFMKKNPIVQAMLPKPENVNKKGSKNPKGIENEHNRQVQNPYTDTITVAPVRSANDYMPPTSFLDSIQRPLPNKNSSSTGAGNIVADLWKFF